MKVPYPAPPEFPAFPTLAELAKVVDPLPEARRQRGLFDALLGGRYDVLYQDSHDRPTAYEDDVKELLERLVGGQVTTEAVTDEERERLHRATMEYMSATPGKPTTPTKASDRKPWSPPKSKPVEMPVADPFWWT